MKQLLPLPIDIFTHHVKRNSLACLIPGFTQFPFRGLFDPEDIQAVLDEAKGVFEMQMQARKCKTMRELFDIDFIWFKIFYHVSPLSDHAAVTDYNAIPDRYVYAEV